MGFCFESSFWVMQCFSDILEKKMIVEKCTVYYHLQEICKENFKRIFRKPAL